MKPIPTPRIFRTVELSFRGDWGGAALHAVSGWLGQQVLDNSGPGSRFAIWSGSGFLDNAQAVARGEVDVAIMTPAASLRMIFGGKGTFVGKPLANLRAIAVLPQNDQLGLAVSADLGVKTFRDIRNRRPALRIATPPNDGVNTVGFVVRELMAASGIDQDVLEGWGGGYVDATRPPDATKLFESSQVNALFHEAIFADFWQKAVTANPTVLVPLERRALDHMREAFDWLPASLPPGHFPNLNKPLPVLDFADFVVLVRDDMPDDVARLLAWSACERRGLLERRYAHIPAHRSPLTYPLEPARMCIAPIPLHPAAAAYYREAGYLSGENAR